MGFRLENTHCLLSSINIRSENHGDEHVPAIDLTFTADDIPADILAPILGVETSESSMEQFKQSFWTEDGPRFSGLTGCGSWAKFEDHHEFKGTLSAEPLVIDKLHKFSFSPSGVFRASVSFQVAIVDPPERLIVNAKDSLKERVTVDIDHHPELPLGEPDGGSDSEEQGEAE